MNLSKKLCKVDNFYNIQKGPFFMALVSPTGGNGNTQRRSQRIQVNWGRNYLQTALYGRNQILGVEVKAHALNAEIVKSFLVNKSFWAWPYIRKLKWEWPLHMTLRLLRSTDQRFQKSMINSEVSNRVRSRLLL